VRRAAIFAVLVALALGACSDDKADRDDGDITDAGPISVFELRPGDCLSPGDDAVGEIENIEAVPCDEPHTQEVFALPEYPDDEGGGAYPGEAEIQQFADASCLEAFEQYTGIDYLNSDLYFTYLHPSVDSWNDDDRTVVCVVTAGGDEMTGSVAGTTTTTERGGGTTSTTEADEDEDEDETTTTEAD
jgi:hypothetical protein